MVDASADGRFMERALLLAERGRGTTSPNPMVGAIIVSPSGVVVGQGAHARAGEAHAEVIALEAAGSRAAGATLYCTLEPCCHAGRTGPCVARIAAASIARVVAATEDPNPRVAGGGFQYLRDRGIGVSVGERGREARRLNAPFLTWITKRRPFVVAKTAVSADGFVGGTGTRVRLTGSVADRFFHRQRAEIDALGIGAQTVLVDDPALTARLVYRERPLVRVVFDWRLRVPPTARLFSTLADGPVIMIVAAQEAERRGPDVDRLRSMGVDFEALDGRDLAGALTRLADRAVLSLLVEGGPVLQAALLGLGLVDRIQWIRTPAMLGGGVPAFPFRLDDPRWAESRLTALGEDLLVETDVHRID